MDKDVPYLRADIVEVLVKETAPRCFHCGVDYEKDTKHCGPKHNTWKPECNCISTTTVRIITGGDVVYRGERWGEDWEN